MQKLTSGKLIGVFGVALLVFAGNANAAIMDTSNSVIWSLDNTVSTPEQALVGSIRDRTLTRSLALDGFNSSLGTLLGVTLRFTSNWILTHEVRGEDPSTGFLQEADISVDGQAVQTLTVDLVSPAGGQQSQTRSQAAACSDDDGSCSQNTGGPGAFNSSLPVLSIADFVDVASVQLLVTNFLSAESGLADADGEDIHSSTARNSWDGQATITYSYETGETIPVSEPPALALMGIGLAGFFAASRKRKTG